MYLLEDEELTRAVSVEQTLPPTTVEDKETPSWSCRNASVDNASEADGKVEIGTKMKFFLVSVFLA